MKIMSLAFVAFVCSNLICPLTAFCGSIILKDGTAEEADKIWVSDQFVHFILKGTQIVEIRLSREIVEKIEYNDGTAQWMHPDDKTSENRATDTLPAAAVSVGRSSVGRSDDKAPDKPDDEKDSEISEITGLQRKALLKANQGLSFYDPRREKRYWARHDARFSHLEPALEYLAKQYNRPLSWIEHYIGEENELSIIHQRFLDQLDKENSGTEPVQDAETNQIENQQEPQLKTNKPMALPDRPSEIEIDPPAEHSTGLHFYDPRRAEKYWTSPTDHHHTLNEAVQSLARRYNVSPRWIETHMGNTNELDLIHRHIQDSLKE